MRALRPSTRALFCAVGAAALAVAAYFSHIAANAVIGVFMLCFAWGWSELVAIGSIWRRRILLALVGGGGVALVLATDGLGWAVAAGAVGVIGSFVLELTRTDGRARLVDSLAASMTGMVIMLSGVGWFAVDGSPLGVALTVTTAGALAAGAACEAIPMPRVPHAVLTLVVTTAVGGLAVWAMPEISYVGAIIGLLAGLLMIVCLRTLGHSPTAGRLGAVLAAAALPVVVVGVPVFALLRYYLV